MPAIVLIGAQWGDEGKGKATDLLGGRVDYVVKFNGGNNAGHTVVVGDEKYALHLLPSGILTPGVVPVIANGVVVDIEVLFDELDALTARGVDVSKLLVSANAHVITAVPPHHRQGDRALPRQAPDRHHRPRHRPDLRRQDQPRRHPDPGPVRREHPAPEGRGRPRPEEPPAGEGLQPPRDHRRRDRRRPARRTPSGCARWSPTPRSCCNQALDAGKTVLFEGGQATMLDVDHGTYPFVTSSNATSGGAATGSGVAPEPDRPRHRASSRRTRPASAPGRSRPSCSTSRASSCAPHGFEFGTTTGRPRRCGWYDAPIARYAARINGVTDFVLTKLDVLTGLETHPGLRRLRGRRRARRRGAGRRRPTSTTRSRSTRSSPAGPRTSPAPATFDGPAEERAGLRARARGDERLAHLGDRRRPRPRRDRRAPRPDRLAPPRDLAGAMPCSRPSVRSGAIRSVGCGARMGRDRDASSPQHPPGPLPAPGTAHARAPPRAVRGDRARGRLRVRLRRRPHTPLRTSEDAFIAWALEHFEWERGNPYAVVLVGGPHDGAVAGTTTLGEFDLRRESAHLGWTAYDPRVWSTVVNPEAKLLLLGPGVRSRIRRVKIQTDALNARSRAAIANRRHLRGHRPRPAASGRHLAGHRRLLVLADEWPDVRGQARAAASTRATAAGAVPLAGVTAGRGPAAGL